MDYRTLQVADRLAIPRVLLAANRYATGPEAAANIRQRKIAILRWLDDHSDSQREVLRRCGDSYRGMPLTALVKVMEDNGFAEVSSFRAGNADLHVFGDEANGIFATADLLEGGLNALTVQFRTFEKGVSHRYDRSLELEPRRYFHGMVDGTHGFRIKLSALVFPRGPHRSWCNLDESGKPFPVVWKSLRIKSATTDAWRGADWANNLSSVGDVMPEADIGIVGELSVASLKSIMGAASIPSVDMGAWLAETAGLLEMHRSRLCTFPAKWRDVADLDFQRRLASEGAAA